MLGIGSRMSVMTANVFKKRKMNRRRVTSASWWGWPTWCKANPIGLILDDAVVAAAMNDVYSCVRKPDRWLPVYPRFARELHAVPCCRDKDTARYQIY